MKAADQSMCIEQPRICFDLVAQSECPIYLFTNAQKWAHTACMGGATGSALGSGDFPHKHQAKSTLAHYVRAPGGLLIEPNTLQSRG